MPGFQQEEHHVYLVLDGDHAVINPIHRLEDFYSRGWNKDVVHGLRFHNNEIMAGYFFMRNTAWSRQYLREWMLLYPHGNHDFGGANGDNGALHWLLLHRLADSSVSGWDECRKMGEDTTSRKYKAFVACCHAVLAKTRCSGI